ncbi:MAG: polysulfide reductase NrfD [Thermomicrobiales bacterium]|nr:polysulfide reductase NrfD [Thermomicrobiales bacterium]
MSQSNRRRSAAPTSPASPYGLPVIRRAHWGWLVVVYFFLGGLSGLSAVVAALASLTRGSAASETVRAGRYLSLAALIPCPLLLILDLRKPARFLNMLRVIKLRSPMSLGVWGLILFSLVSGLGVARQAASDGFLGAGRLAAVTRRLPEQTLAIVTIPLGLFLAGYTGVLLAATAVPLWAKRGLLLGPLFLSSALSGSAAAIAAALAVRRPSHGEVTALARLERIATLAEAALLWGWLTRLGATAKPLMSGGTGRAVRHGAAGAGLALPLVLNATATITPAHWRRSLTLIASALTLLGGFLLRYAIVFGGNRSADDPAAAFALTRAEPRR